MAIFFGKKKDEPEPSPSGDGAGSPGGAKGAPAGEGGFTPEPDKAKRFFDHAHTVQETGNFAYAIQLWLSGLKFDPTSMTALTSFFQCAAQFLGEAASRKGPGKDLLKSVSGNLPAEKYVRGLLEWSMRPEDATLAVRAFEQAVSMKLAEPASWIGERAFGFTLKEKRVSKDLLVRVSGAFKDIGLMDKAVAAGEEAYKLDPSDGELKTYIRQLAASATMTKGGYDKPNQEGGFRQNIRDSTKQRHLDEAERIVKTDETHDRVVVAAEEELKKRPGDLVSIEGLAKRLLDRAKGTDEERAHELYMEALKLSNQFRFRELAGNIRIKQQARKVRELETMLQQSPTNEMLQRMRDSERDILLRLELDEYKLRVENYPTDLARKFELGKRHFELGQAEESIGLFQEAQQDAKFRLSALNYLGQAFLRINYTDEAVVTFRTALEHREMAPELNMELQYHLMCALTQQAQATRNADALREAAEFASSIAMKQFNYRDIRTKREEIKRLLAEWALPPGPSPAPA